MNVKEVRAGSVLNPSKLTDYCINPYTGCQHGCVYCYARFMCRYGGHPGEKWGSFVDVKTNAAEILEKELGRRPRGSIFMSSVTDPYQPLEKKYELTKKILQKLLEHDFPLSIQTKSSLILRDAGLLSRMKHVEAGMTITCLDDSDRKNFEPFTTPVQERLETIRKLGEAGIKTYVFLGPFLPGISDKNLGGLISGIAEAGADYIFFDRLNIKCGNWEDTRPVIAKHYPSLLKTYENIFFAGGGGYYETIRQRVQQLCRENSLDVRFCY
jgi:DNA repair photolyase